MARSTSAHSAVRVSTSGRADRLTVLAVLRIGLDILCFILSTAGYSHSGLCILTPDLICNPCPNGYGQCGL